MIYVGIENIKSKDNNIMSELPSSQLDHIYKNKGRLEHVRTAAALILHRLIKEHAPWLVPYEIAYTDLGRPYIAGAKSIDFSISYADNCAAVALCIGEKARIGIDIEKVAKAKLGVAKKHFTDEENDLLASLSAKETDEEFTKLWTRYESKAKYLGGGLADIRKDAAVHIHTELFEDDLGNRYALSVCSENENKISIHHTKTKLRRLS